MRFAQKTRILLCVVLTGLLIVLAAPLCVAQTDSDSAETTDEAQDVTTYDELPEEQTDAVQSEEAAAAEPSLDESSFDETVREESLAAPEASVFTGSATYKVPIRVPPARALTPEIALTYSSHRGNSWGGWGSILPWARFNVRQKRGWITMEPIL